MSTTPVAVSPVVPTAPVVAKVTKPVVAKKVTKPAVVKTPKVAKVAKVKAVKVPVVKKERTRFYMLGLTGSKYAVLSPKATSAAEAQKMLGLTSVRFAKELATNRHLAVVQFCDEMDAVPGVTTPVKVATEPAVTAK